MKDIKMLDGFKYKLDFFTKIFYALIVFALVGNILSGDWNDVAWIILLFMNVFMADSAMGMYQIRTKEVKELYGKK